MKILSIIKGFVTNSSSANYWEDEDIQETDQTQSTSTAQNVNQSKDSNGLLESFAIWLIFSIILVATFILKKSKGKKTYPQIKQKVFTFILSILIFISSSFYLSARHGLYDLQFANQAIAATALVLIGLSYALGPLAYFLKFLSNKISYRRNLGLTGFTLGLIHPAVTLLFLKKYFPPFNPIAETLALIALVIFTSMMIVSNRYVSEKLKRKQKLIFHLGYYAFILILFHSSIPKYPFWIDWFQNKNQILPPLTLILAIFGLGVIILRITHWFALRKKKMNPTPL